MSNTQNNDSNVTTQAQDQAVTIAQQGKAVKESTQDVQGMFGKLGPEQSLLIEFDQELQSVAVYGHMVKSSDVPRRLADNVLVVPGNKKPSNKDFTLTLLALSSPSLGKRNRAKFIPWVENGCKGAVPKLERRTRSK